MFLLAGVGFLGTVDTVGRVETRAKHFLLALTVATTHRLDDIVQIDGLFLLFLLHDTTIATKTMPTPHPATATPIHSLYFILFLIYTCTQEKKEIKRDI